jgi:hypothetical protein
MSSDILLLFSISSFEKKSFIEIHDLCFFLVGFALFCFVFIIIHKV